MVARTPSVPWAASWTLRAISRVAEPFSSTAEATVVASALTRVMVSVILAMASTVLLSDQAARTSLRNLSTLTRRSPDWRSSSVAASAILPAS